jgi:TatA/E family protein of Tat protein translocase
MLGLGWPEVILILALLLLIFGPTKLPKIARDLGKAVREFQKASSGIMEEIDKATLDVTKAIPPSSTGTAQPSIRTGDKSKDDKESSSISKNKLRRDKGLSDIAKKLNIPTEGKTSEQITQEIIMKIEGKKKASNNTAVKR